MSEAVKRQWLTDNEGVKVAPYTTIDQIIMPDGTRFENKYEEDTDNTTQLITNLENKYEEDIHNTMQLIYSDYSETYKTVNLDMAPYKGKIAVLISGNGGLYTIAGLNMAGSVIAGAYYPRLNTIKEDKSVSYVGTSGTQLIIAFKGIIYLFCH